MYTGMCRLTGTPMPNFGSNEKGVKEINNVSNGFNMTLFK
jgi:hypothetical protein